MIKSLIVIILLVNSAKCSLNIVNDLQEQFKQDVIELNIFKKRYGKYLVRQCKDNLLCYKKKIIMLKSWKAVQEDDKLEYYLEQKRILLQYNDKYWKSLVNKLENKKINLKKSQFVSVVDLNKQRYIITLWNNELQKFYFIGQDSISSGNMNREKEVKFGESHYFKTPIGIFKSNNGWRSEGKVKEDKVTLGYGHKNRYIFYFGEQQSIRYNTFDKNKNKITNPKKWKIITDQLNLAVHSHKSSKSMGEANSHGCVRMTDELNRFLDNNSILHKNTLKGENWIHKYSQKPNYLNYHNYAGEYLVIFNKVN